VGAQEFERALDKVYKKQRGSIAVPGFRKGKAPRKIIEGMYGSGVFYEDAIEELFPPLTPRPWSRRSWMWWPTPKWKSWSGQGRLYL
jgi:hypothetical protein